LSDGPLPDWRIEKAAISSKNRGYDVYFAGLKPKSNYKRNLGPPDGSKPREVLIGFDQIDEYMR
jgi:hypothetical protein